MLRMHRDLHLMVNNPSMGQDRLFLREVNSRVLGTLLQGNKDKEVILISIQDGRHFE